MIEIIKLKSVLQESFDKALMISKRNTFIQLRTYIQLNSLKSAKFVSDFANNMYKDFFNYPGIKLNVIEVDDKGKKYPGEWLLDITITKDVNGFKDRILLAVESESNTSKKAFDEDFAKLIHIKAENYIYLNGLDQKSINGKDNYITNRISYAEKLMRNMRINNFYLGFWASPRKIGNVGSIWDELPDGKFKHLSDVSLYKFIKGNFQEI